MLRILKAFKVRNLILIATNLPIWGSGKRFFREETKTGMYRMFPSTSKIQSLCKKFLEVAKTNSELDKRI